MPPAALISILQKGLQYVEAEISINEVRAPHAGPESRTQRGPVSFSLGVDVVGRCRTVVVETHGERAVGARHGTRQLPHACVDLLAGRSWDARSTRSAA